jgi:hypothetical protein
MRAFPAERGRAQRRRQRLRAELRWPGEAAAGGAPPAARSSASPRSRRHRRSTLARPRRALKDPRPRPRCGALAVGLPPSRACSCTSRPCCSYVARAPATAAGSQTLADQLARRSRAGGEGSGAEVRRILVSGGRASASTASASGALVISNADVRQTALDLVGRELARARLARVDRLAPSTGVRRVRRGDARSLSASLSCETFSFETVDHGPRTGGAAARRAGSPAPCRRSPIRRSRRRGSTSSC